MKGLCKRFGTDRRSFLELGLRSMAQGETPDVGLLRRRLEGAGKRMTDLAARHAPLASVVASLRFRWYTMSSACQKESMVLLSLEAEHRALATLVGVPHDASHQKEEEDLFDRYNGSSG
ncbi:MAG: hypothetical protein JRN39_02660 [Nitrososphaerota archaeon]|nr:hypothetical protein [Nitrososphaerota archaeon]